MQTVTSKERTTIAYDRYGSGPAVILVGGALSYRKFKKMEELAKLLARRCTVINYDRRGRGDSTEVKPFALDREIEDVAALIEAEGALASLWGWSSGGALALRAAGAGIGVTRLSVYEVPFMVEPRNGRRRPTASGSTSWSPPTIEAARSSTSCATRSVSRVAGGDLRSGAPAPAMTVSTSDQRRSA